MLKSMVEAPRPTRAEVTDVANAIYDGTDAIMLSEETAMGRYPVEAVEVMSRVAADTEQQFDYEGWTEKYAHSEHRLSYGDAVAHAAVKMAEDIEAAAILTCTRSGGTTLRVARHRPRQVVLSLTPERTTALRMALTFGAVPVYIDLAQTVEDLEKMALEKALAGGFVGPGDPVVLTAGVPFADKLATNMIKVVTA